MLCGSFSLECRLPLAESPPCFAAAAVMPDNQHRLPLFLGAAGALRLGGTTEATAGVRCSPKGSSLRDACGRSSPITSGRVRATCIRQRVFDGRGLGGRLGSTSRSYGRAVDRPVPDRTDRNTWPRGGDRGAPARRATTRQRPESRSLALRKTARISASSPGLAPPSRRPMARGALLRPTTGQHHAHVASFLSIMRSAVQRGELLRPMRSSTQPCGGVSGIADCPGRGRSGIVANGGSRSLSPS